MFKCLLLHISVLLHFAVQAQILPIKTYTVHNGLSGNGVYSILRDVRGILWVGTNYGINWYDGNRFIQPAVIARGGQLFVNQFYEDNRHNIWTCTFYNGLYKYDMHEQRFYNFYVDPSKPEANCNNVLSIIELAADRMLVATDDNVYLFDGQHFTLFDAANKELVTQVATIAQLPDGDLLLGAIQGIYWYKKTKTGWVFYKHVMATVATNYIFPDGTACWIATNQGLFYYNSKESLESSPPQKVFCAGQLVNYINKDRTGNIIAGAGKGAFKIIDDSLVSYSFENGLPGYNTHCVYNDFENNLWFATDYGLARLNDEFYRYFPLSDKFPLEVLSGLKQGNTLWIGYLGGLRKIEGYKTQDITSINNRPLQYTFFITPDKTGRLWIGTDIGIYTIQGNTFTLRYPARASCMYEDSTGTIWFGCQDGSILYCKNNVFNKARYELEKKENVETIYRDEHGFLWIGLFRFGVRQFKVLEDTLIVSRAYSDKNGFDNLRVRSILYDKKGHLIFGSRTNGIYIIPVNDSNARSVININSAKGLHATWVKGMTTDGKGNILMATNTGLHILSGNDYNHPLIRSVPFANEKVPLEMNTIFKDEDAFWLGTTGIIQYLPALQVKDTASPLVYITQVSIGGKSDTSFHAYETLHHALFLPYDQNVLSFDFAGLSFKDEKAVRYRYILEGRDAEWSEPTDHRFISYGGLPPGKYDFKVIACNADGVWSRSPAVFSFTIASPFWKTPWFIALIVLIVSAALYSFYRYRLNKGLQFERLRMKISTDLHDDIGSTLSSISILSEMVIREAPAGIPNDMVKEIKDNSVLLMEKMDDIVWSINPKNDSLENLLIRIKRFAAQLFEAKGIEYDIQIQENINQFKLPMQYRQHIYLVMKEAINNLVKHAYCTNAVINVSFYNGELHVIISDNGKGFDINKTYAGNGLLSMQHRASLAKASLTIESAPDKGTAVTLRVKIK